MGYVAALLFGPIAGFLAYATGRAVAGRLPRERPHAVARVVARVAGWSVGTFVFSATMIGSGHGRELCKDGCATTLGEAAVISLILGIAFGLMVRGGEA